MGVIYKLKPEIMKFILETKKSKPSLSCRGLTSLVSDKFNIAISKSSINAIIKEAGLSMAIGRRCKIRRKLIEPIKTLMEAPQVKALMEIIPVEKPGVAPTPPPSPVEPPVEETKVSPLLPLEEPEVTPTPAPAPVEEPEVTPTPPPSPGEPPVEAVTQLPTEQEVTTPSPPPIELPMEAEGLGAIMLKAADYLIGGSFSLTEIIKNRLESPAPDLLAKTESLLYASLFGIAENTTLKPDCGFWPLINYRLTSQDIYSYLNKLQEAEGLNTELFRIIPSVLQEVRGILINLAQGNVLYLDGQLHTVWSTTHISYDFSTTLYNVKRYINKCFQNEGPCVLFMAPGYDTPTKEFFDFILSLEARKNRISRATLYNNKFEELETIHFEETKKQFFVFGLWPWQFGQYRKVKLTGEFCPFYFEPLKKDLFIAEGEIELTQPNINQIVALRVCVLKTGLKEKIRLLVLSNLSLQKVSSAELITIYLSRWPNLEEAFEDFSRKIELFTYTANSQRFFTTDNLSLTKEPPADINSLFRGYLQALDSYVRWHFLPSGYEDKDFSTAKERFYGLKVLLERKKDYILATFKPPAGYAFLKDLGYACRRLNEREIKFSDGSRIWFNIM